MLQTGVGKIIEENFLHGIRSNNEVSYATAAIETVTEIPSKASIFPELQNMQETPKSISTSSVLHDKIVHLQEVDRSWTLVEKSSGSKYISNMQRYNTKMSQLFSTKNINQETHASKGDEMAILSCSTIFERIESLRGKGTKPMKQRALVDLFKYLRKQGYSSMKWSVPKEIRDMNHLLQLPSPISSSLNCQYSQSLEEAEHYFRRCTIELSRLRSEVSMIGSPYMSKREMELMTGFGEHGLLMLCQQRSVVMKKMHQLETLTTLISAFDKIGGNLPDDQISLLELFQHFDRTYNSLLETLQQTLLAAKTTASLDKENGTRCTRKK